MGLPVSLQLRCMVFCTKCVLSKSCITVHSVMLRELSWYCPFCTGQKMIEKKNLFVHGEDTWPILNRVLTKFLHFREALKHWTLSGQDSETSQTQRILFAYLPCQRDTFPKLYDQVTFFLLHIQHYSACILFPRPYKALVV